jgi:hypothetical protein
MSGQGRTPRGRFQPTIEGLEDRQLLSAGTTSTTTARVAQAQHELHKYVSDLQDIELHSQATPAEYLALRDDARTISAAASTSPLDRPTAQSKAVVVSLQLDRSVLYGSLGDSGWSVVSGRVTTNLASLNVAQPVIDRTLADMKAAAASAGVTSANFQTFTSDFNRYAYYRSQVSSSYSNTQAPHHVPLLPDPQLYFTQHLRGFFRDWAVRKSSDEAKLASDIRSIETETPATPAAVSLIQRDVRILQDLGAAIPSESNHAVDDAYIAVFDHGLPTAQDLAQLKTTLLGLLGATATPSRTASLNRLISDAPAFDLATGSSPANIATIVNDVRAVVDDGGDSLLNPFRVTVYPGQAG